jgi:hypothetical protein
MENGLGGIRACRSKRLATREEGAPQEHKQECLCYRKDSNEDD